MTRKTNRSGFTLLEVLVSMVMVGIIVTAIFGTLLTSLQAWEKGIKVSEELQTDRALLDRVSSELKSSIHSLKPGRGRLMGEGKGSGESAEDTLVFTSSSGGWPGQVVVRYRIGKEPEGDGEGLLRAEILLPGKLDWEKIEKNLDKQEHLFVPSIAAMDVEYYDGEDWKEEWDPEGTEKDLPVAVRVAFFEEIDSKESRQLPEIFAFLARKEEG